MDVRITHQYPPVLKPLACEFPPATKNGGECVDEDPEGRVFQLDPPCKCNICGKEFAIPARLQRHHRVHTGEKPFCCEFCNKTFSVKENLNVHRRIHTKERPYKCSICERAFEHSGKLHRHMRTHTGERPHECKVCGKTFVQSGQLVIHMRAHTGEKPYTCDYCQKGFTCSKQLKVHIRTHTGEKPYECGICGKTFGYNHVLKMHKMSHLGEKLYKCTLCDEFFSSRKALDRHIREHGQGTDLQKQNSPSLPSAANLEQKETTHPVSELNVSSENDHSQNDDTVQLQACQDFREANGISNLCSPTSMQLKSHSPGYVSDDSGRGPSPVGDTLTPPRTPESGHHHTPSSVKEDFGRGESHSSDEASTKKRYGTLIKKLYPNLLNLSPLGENDIPRLAFFTTASGEHLACPVDLLLHVQDGDRSSSHGSHAHLQQKLMERLLQEEERRQREEDFCGKVVRIMESLMGSERMHRLGYPSSPVDQVVMNILEMMGTQPCSEPSLAAMDRIKVNLRLLLETCVSDPQLWISFGWRGKSIEEIMAEFLQHC